VKLFLAQFLLVVLYVEALPAERHVSLITTDQLDCLYQAGSECEGSIGATELADGGQFFHFFRLGDQVDDRVEASSHERSVQGRDDHYFALVGCSLGEVNDLKVFS